MMLYWINATYFCAGVVTDDSGTVIEAAPILKWTIGLRISEVIRRLQRKNVLIEYHIIQQLFRLDKDDATLPLDVFEEE